MEGTGVGAALVSAVAESFPGAPADLVAAVAFDVALVLGQVRPATSPDAMPRLLRRRRGRKASLDDDARVLCGLLDRCRVAWSRAWGSVGEFTWLHLGASWFLVSRERLEETEAAAPSWPAWAVRCVVSLDAGSEPGVAAVDRLDGVYELLLQLRGAGAHALVPDALLEASGVDATLFAGFLFGFPVVYSASEGFSGSLDANLVAVACRCGGLLAFRFTYPALPEAAAAVEAYEAAFASHAERVRRAVPAFGDGLRLRREAAAGPGSIHL